MPGSRRILRHGRAADPWRWCAALTLAFAALTFWRLGIPSKIYFDELHYVPAARALLHMRRANPEHPMVAKLAIALAIRLFGDHPAAWRLPSALMGTVGLWAFSRALCLASGRRVATVVGTLLLACNFAWFVQSRVAMLDMVMAGFAMVMLWQVLAAVRLPAGHAGRARLHLLAAGVAMGLSLGAKWSVLPVIVLVPLALAAVRVAVAGPRALTRSNAPPMQGISLAELALWLGLLPLAVYVASFTPIALWRDNTVPLTHIVAWHRYMVQLQASVIKHHPYQSVWWQWVIDWRPIWFLYENVDGAQRGILLLGNPFAMLAGLPAMVWCLWRGVATFGARRAPRLGAATHPPRRDRGRGGAAVDRDGGYVGDRRQAGAVLLPLPASRRLPDGLSGAGAGRVVERGAPLGPDGTAALAGAGGGGAVGGAVRMVLPHPRRATARRAARLCDMDVAE